VRRRSRRLRATFLLRFRILFDSLLTSVPPSAGPGAGFAAVDRMIDELRAAGVSVGRAEDPIGTDETALMPRAADTFRYGLDLI
jgi:hypothetical protein